MLDTAIGILTLFGRVSLSELYQIPIGLGHRLTQQYTYPYSSARK